MSTGRRLLLGVAAVGAALLGTILLVGARVPQGAVVAALERSLGYPLDIPPATSGRPDAAVAGGDGDEGESATADPFEAGLDLATETATDGRQRALGIERE